MRLKLKGAREANRATFNTNPKNPPKSFPTTRQQKVLLVRKLVGGFQGFRVQRSILVPKGVRPLEGKPAEGKDQGEGEEYRKGETRRGENPQRERTREKGDPL